MVVLKKWFWFGDYEGTRIDNPNPIFERVPSSYDRSHLNAVHSRKPGTRTPHRLEGTRIVSTVECNCGVRGAGVLPGTGA